MCEAGSQPSVTYTLIAGEVSTETPLCFETVRSFYPIPTLSADASVNFFLFVCRRQDRRDGLDKPVRRPGRHL
jgi:hypothetical protein